MAGEDGLEGIVQRALAELRQGMIEDALWVARTVRDETYVPDEEIARHFGMTLRAWRTWYEREPALLALALNLGSATRRQLRWRIADVALYLRRRR